MRDVFEEYKMGLITWDEAYRIANNNAATAADVGNSDEVDYWVKMMNDLGVDLAEQFMKMLGYKQNDDGAFFKPGET